MLGAIQCREQEYGKGFLSSYPRARVSSLKVQGRSSSKCTHHALEGHDDIHDRVPSADGEASSTPCSRRRPRLTRLKRDEGSGRVQRGDGDGGEEGRDTVQERCDRVGHGQVEAHPILVRFALRRHWKEREDHGGRLGRGQCRVGQRGRAEGMGEDIGGARQEEPPGVGQARRRRGPVAVAGALDCLAIVFAMPPRPGEVFIPLWGGGATKAGTTKRGWSPAALTSAGTSTRHGWDQHAAPEKHASDRRVLAGRLVPWPCARALRCWERPRASCMTEAAWRSNTA